MGIEKSAEAMKEYGRKLSLCMGIMMSFCLSAIGLFSANAFTPLSLLLNFAISFTVISIVSRFFNAERIAVGVLERNSIDPGSIKGRMIQALIVDLIYSPIMTFAMVTIAYVSASKNGNDMPYIPMLLKGLAVSFVAAFFLCLIFVPIFEKILNRKAVEEK